jgi:hypothetical protein
MLTLNVIDYDFDTTGVIDNTKKLEDLLKVSPEVCTIYFPKVGDAVYTFNGRVYIEKSKTISVADGVLINGKFEYESSTLPESDIIETAVDIESEKSITKNVKKVVDKITKK